jgi:oligoribonuclease
MKYVIIDIETTGVPGKDGALEELQIIEFGAIIEDTNNPLAWDDIPKFNKIIRHEQYTGGAFAINLNARIFDILAKRETINKDGREEYDKLHEIIELKDLAQEFFEFLIPHLGVFPDGDSFEGALEQVHKYKQAPLTITPAGKNFDAFDRKFIELIPKWNNYIRLRHRTLDPTTAYVDWYNDEQPPGLGECLQRAGIIKQVTHKAVEDCWDTLEVLRKEYSVKKTWMKS